MTAIIDTPRPAGRPPRVASRRRRKLPWLLASILPILTLAPVVLLAGAGNPCIASASIGPSGAPVAGGAGAGGFEETAYGPPWNAENGTGQTAYGPDLTAGPPALVIAIDPTVLTPHAYYHVWPNPLHARGAFLAGDTGAAIIGRHIDTYDWRGRGDQLAWGTRYGITVTRAATPGAGSATGQLQAPASTLTPIQGACAQLTATKLAPGVYADPFRASIGLTPLRIDMGVDYSATGPIAAIGNATVTYAAAGGAGWGPFSCSGGHGGAIVYRLNDGPDAGRSIYTAEGIIPNVRVGQQLKAGEPIATFTGCIEIGWASGAGDGPQAAVLGQACGSGGDPGCHCTACGQNMSQLIAALGAKPGIQETPIYGKGC